MKFDLDQPIINDSTVEHYCFGCGNLNPIGLKLRFRPLEDESIWADFTPGREYEGYLGMTHGGILSTILDEAMSWAITYRGDIGVTARMTVTFRNPASVGEPLRVIGRVTQARKRVFEAEAELQNQRTGSIIAKAEARFIRVSKQQAAEWMDAYGPAVSGTAFGDAADRYPS